MRRIRYAVTASSYESALHLTLDPATYDERMAAGGLQFDRAGNYLMTQKVLTSSAVGASTMSSFDVARIGRRRNDELRYRDIRATALLLSVMGNYGELDEVCPDLAIDIGGRYADGRLGMGAWVRWPAEEPRLLQEGATLVMRDIAQSLNYVRDVASSPKKYRRLIDDIVFARISRQQGVTLESNAIGSCDLGTDGQWYRADEPVYELYDHNIYNHEQQLILYAGAVVLAGSQNLD